MHSYVTPIFGKSTTVADYPHLIDLSRVDLKGSIDIVNDRAVVDFLSKCVGNVGTVFTLGDEVTYHIGFSDPSEAMLFKLTFQL